MSISPQAIVDPAATLAEGCSVAAFALIKGRVELGEGVSVDHHAVLGGLPQDLHFDAAIESGVRIGASTIIREGVTINRATQPGAQTSVGDNCFLMANSHLGHDVKLGDYVILANGALLGGHVQVGDHAFIGGGAIFHQFVRIGEGAIVSGGAQMAYDIPPFVLASGRNRASGLNLVGMKRRNFSKQEIEDVKACYKAVYFQPGNPRVKAQDALEAGVPQTERGRQFLEFFAASKRGFIRSVNERS